MTSALIKYLRLGDAPKSIEIFNRMKVVGVPDSYIVHRLCAFAWEDSNSTEALTYVAALKTTWQDDPDNAMTRTILALARLPKFWHSRQGAEDETMRLRIREEVLQLAKKGRLIIDDFPAFVRDRFTCQGRMLKKAGAAISELFSGTIEGGNHMRAQVLVYGSVSPDHPSLFDTDEVRESAARNLSVDEYLEERGMTVEEWKKMLQAHNN